MAKIGRKLESSKYSSIFLSILYYNVCGGLVFCKLLAYSENIAYLCVTNINIVTMDEKNNRRNDGQLQLELPQEVAMGEYANFAIITHCLRLR